MINRDEQGDQPLDAKTVHDEMTGKLLRIVIDEEFAYNVIKTAIKTILQKYRNLVR